MRWNMAPTSWKSTGTRIETGQNVLIVDDVLATGGTAAAAAKLVEKLGGKVAGLSFVIELDFLNGRDKLPGYDVQTLLALLGSDRCRAGDATVKSLAKINLDLRVLNKRPDGFHELRTVFQTISLADTIDIEYEPARRTEHFDRRSAGHPGQSDPAGRASGARCTQAPRDECSFRLRKQIPMGGGLGGGSSNAAAVLLALPVLGGTADSVERLLDLAAELERRSLLPDRRHAVARPGHRTLCAARRTAASRYWWSPRASCSHRTSLSGTGPRFDCTAIRHVKLMISRPLFGAWRVAFGGGGECVQRERFRGGRFPSASPAPNDWAKVVGSSARPGVRMTGSGSALFAVFDSAAGARSRRSSVEGDRVFEEVPGHSGSLVSRASYQRLWRRQLRQHVSDLIKAYGRPKAGTRNEIQPLQSLHGQRQSRAGGEDLLRARLPAGARSTSSRSPTAKSTCRSRKTCAAPTFSWSSRPARRWTGT